MGPAIVHESGHALMALLKGFPCHGICFGRYEGKFCVLLGEIPKDQSRKDYYLASAAGVAAELLFIQTK